MQQKDPSDWLQSMDNKHTLSHTHIHTHAQSVVCGEERGGCKKSLFYKAHIRGIIHFSRASGGGMIAMWDERSEKKKTKTPPLHRGPVSEQLDTHKHTPSQTWLKHKFPFYSAPLTHPHKHTRPPEGPVTSTHHSQSKQPQSSRCNKVHPPETTLSIKPGKEGPRPGKRPQTDLACPRFQRSLKQVGFLPPTHHPCSIPPVAPDRKHSSQLPSGTT